MSVKVIIESGSAVRVLSGWNYLEAEHVYLLPVRRVDVGPGLHVLRPVGELNPDTLAIEVALLSYLPNRER